MGNSLPPDGYNATPPDGFNDGPPDGYQPSILDRGIAAVKKGLADSQAFKKETNDLDAPPDSNSFLGRERAPLKAIANFVAPDMEKVGNDVETIAGKYGKGAGTAAALASMITTVPREALARALPKSIDDVEKLALMQGARMPAAPAEAAAAVLPPEVQAAPPPPASTSTDFIRIPKTQALAPIEADPLKKMIEEQLAYQDALRAKVPFNRAAPEMQPFVPEPAQMPPEVQGVPTGSEPPAPLAPLAQAEEKTGLEQALESNAPLARPDAQERQPFMPEGYDPLSPPQRPLAQLSAAEKPFKQLISEINQDLGERGAVGPEGDPRIQGRLNENVKEVIRRAREEGYNTAEEITAFAAREGLRGSDLVDVSKAVPSASAPAAPPGPAPIAEPPAPTQQVPLAPVEEAAHQNILSRIKPLGTDRPSSSIGDKVTQFYQDTVNRFHSIEKMAEMAGPLPPGENPKFLARSYLGVAGKAQSFVEGQAFRLGADGNIEFTGPGLKQAIAPMKDAQGDLSAYLVARRTLNLSERGIETGISPAQAQIEVSALEKRYPQVRQVAEQVNKWNDNLLKYLQDSGRIGQDQYDAIKANNAFYVPMERVMEAVDSPNFAVRSKEIFNRIANPVRKIEGSARDILDPIDVMVKNSFKIVEAADRNRVAKSVVELPKYNPEMASLFTPVEKPTAKSITAFVDGVAQHYEVPDMLAQAMRGLHEESMGMLQKLFSFPARILRAGATLDPHFAARNPIRDQWNALVNAKYGYFPPYDFPRGVFNLVSGGDSYERWMASGGAQSFLTSMDDAVSAVHAADTPYRSQLAEYVKNPLKVLEAISESGEKPTRMGVFSKAKAAGASDLEAGFESREATTDFARRGAQMKSLNSIYAFFNARLQGLEKTVRVFRDRPVQASVAASPIVAASVWEFMAHKDNPDYWELPQYRRDMFWNFKAGDHWVGIPKGDIGMLFGTTTEHILKHLADQKDDHFGQYVANLLDNMSPMSMQKAEFIPTGLRPVVENMANHSFFRDRPIVPQSKQELLPEYQYTDQDSETARALGKKFGVSPAKISNAYTGLTGGLGRMSVDAMDAIGEKAHLLNHHDTAPRELADTPIVRAFVQRNPVGSASESVARFYREEQNSAQAAHSLGRLTGDPKLILDQLPDTPEDAARWAPLGLPGEIERLVDQHPEFAFQKVYHKVSQSFTQIQHGRDAIIHSNLPDDAKREKLLALDTAMTQMARKVNDAFDRYMQNRKAGLYPQEATNGR